MGNEKRICLINSAVTGTIGVFLLSMWFNIMNGFSGAGNNKWIYAGLAAFYPVSFYITKLFLLTGKKSARFIRVRGGVFSFIGTAFVYLLCALINAGFNLEFINSGGIFTWLAIFFFSFLIGFASAFIITNNYDLSKEG